MPRYCAFDGAVGAGVESAYGTAVARSNWFQATSFTPTETVTSYQPRNLRRKGGMLITSPLNVKEEVTLSWDGEFSFDYLGVILEAALGAAVSTTGAGPYTHTYAMTDECSPEKFLTVEGGLGDSGNSVLYRGTCVNTLTLTINPNDVTKYSVDCIAQQANAPASIGTPAYATTYSYINNATDLGTVTWNSINLTDDEIGSITVTLNNNLQTSFGVNNQHTNIPYYSGDGRTVEVVMDVQYGSTIADALRTANRAGTQSDLVIPFTAGTDQVTLTIRNAYVDSSSIPPMADADDMRYSVTFRGVSDTSDAGFEIVVVNSSASGIANA